MPPSIHLYGQEINAETDAICTADLLLKGEGEAADNIVRRTNSENRVVPTSVTG